MAEKPLRLALWQFSPVLRDPAANARSIADAAAGAGADLLLTPELSLTGYDLGDDAAELAETLRPGAPVPWEPLADSQDVVVGCVERGAGSIPYNTAAYLSGGRVRFRHRKVYLPTYGMFDEGRFFGRGSRLDAFELPGGWRAGLLVCEDFWHPALAYLLAARGIDLLLVMAAAPGRGVWEGADGADGYANWPMWERMVRSTAGLYGIYVALCNRVGVEGGVTFAGGSLVAGPDGEVIERAPYRGEALVRVVLTPSELQRTRRPYAHARDDDPRFTLRELARLLDEPAG